MAIELITSKACGTKNPTHRTVCRSCGADFETAKRKGKEPAKSATTKLLWEAIKRPIKNLIAEPVPGHLKIKPGFYFLLWVLSSILLTIINGFIVDQVLGLWDDIHGRSFWYSLAGSGLSFVLVYMLATKIGRGAARFSEALRRIVGFILFCFGSSVLFLPLLVILGEGTILENLFLAIVFYVGAAITVVIVVTLLSWLNNTSPWEEIWRSMDLFHHH